MLFTYYDFLDFNYNSGFNCVTYPGLTNKNRTMLLGHTASCKVKFENGYTGDWVSEQAKDQQVHREAALQIGIGIGIGHKYLLLSKD